MMLEGLRDVVAQIALIVAVTALLASLLGWILGRASGKRRAEKSAAAITPSRLTRAPARSHSPRHAIEATEDASVPVAEDVLAPVPSRPIVDVTEPVDALVFFDAAARQHVQPSSHVENPVVEPVATDTLAEPADDGGDEDEDTDPDRTVLRPAPGMTPAPGTPLYTPPPLTVVTSAPSESEPAAGLPASVQEVQELRRELRAKELELGKLEAGALSAWDRTVPHLEAQISALLDENAWLRRQIRDAEEHSAADTRTVERLRSLVAERDSLLAEIRAQS
jgi:hypothetical protein